MFLVSTYCFRYGIGHMRRKGFSLLELVVVLAIMGTLAAVAVPVYSNVTDNSSTGALVSSADGIVKSANSRAQSDPLNPGRGTTINDIVLAAGDEDVELLAGDGATSGVRIYGQKDLCINVSITGSASGSVAVSGDPYECLSGSPATTSTTAPPSNNSPTPTTTAAPTTTVPGFTPTIGAAGPGGGIVFYVDLTGFACGPTLAATCTYLEVAPFAAQVQRTWVNSTNWVVPFPGTYSDALGAGMQNTLTVQSQSVNSAGDSAAVYALEYTNNGQDDWFMPSRAEFEALFAQQEILDAGFIAWSAYAVSGVYTMSEGGYGTPIYAMPFGTTSVQFYPYWSSDALANIRPVRAG